MAGSKEPSHAELFLRERPGAGEPAVLEARLQEIVERSVRAWPELAIDPARLVVHLAHVVGDDVAQGLADLFVEDFALGLACVDNRPGALTQLERPCAGARDAAGRAPDRP